HHVIIQGVQLVGAIDGDERDAFTDLEQEGLVGHGGNLMRNVKCEMRNLPENFAFRISHFTLGSAPCPSKPSPGRPAAPFASSTNERCLRPRSRAISIAPRRSPTRSRSSRFAAHR